VCPSLSLNFLDAFADRPSLLLLLGLRSTQELPFGTLVRSSLSSLVPFLPSIILTPPPTPGQFYGQPDDPTANLKLLRRFFDKYPETVDKVTLSVKGAAHPEGIHHGPDSSIENLRRDLGIIREALGDKKSIDVRPCPPSPPAYLIQMT
jgi:hypothetical protein